MQPGGQKRFEPDIPDAALIQGAQAGDQTSLGIILQRYYRLVYFTAYRLVGNRQDAEDVTQEALINIAKNISSFEAGAKFSSWAHAITANVAKDHYRKGKRYLHVVSDYSQEKSKGVEKPDDDKNELSKTILNALDKLPPKYRQAIVMTIYDDLSHAEVAKIMNCAETTVSWYVHEARKALHIILKKEIEE